MQAVLFFCMDFRVEYQEKHTINKKYNIFIKKYILEIIKKRIVTSFLGYDAALYVVEITGLEPVTS